jgi:hypothetical protein
MLKVSTTREEFNLWARYRFEKSPILHKSLLPYVAIGFGGQKDLVRTSFNGQDESQEPESVNTLMKIATGLNASLSSSLQVDLESSLGASSGYTPNPQFGIGLLLGWRF